MNKAKNSPKAKQNDIPLDVLGFQANLTYKDNPHSNRHLKDSSGCISITRIIKKLYIPECYDISLKLDKDYINDECITDKSIYISKFQIYQYCKNIINDSFSIMKKADDSTFISWSRIDFREELNLYLFALIHPDTLNFADKNHLANKYINDKFKDISEQQYLLKNSILLDSFCLAVCDLLLNTNAECYLDIDLSGLHSINNDIKNGIKNTPKNKKSLNDNIIDLWEFFSPTIIFFEILNREYREMTNEVLCDTMNTENLQKYITTNTIFANKNVASKKCKALTNSFQKWSKLFSDNKVSSLRTAINLFHINKYTHIIDMKIMKDNTYTNIVPYRFVGLYTQKIISSIFNNNRRQIQKDFDSVRFSQEKTNYNSRHLRSITATDNIFENYFDERDLIFVNSIITRMAESFKNLFLVTRSNHNSDYTTLKFDYKKVMRLVKNWEYDNALIEFLFNLSFKIDNDFEINPSHYREIKDYLSSYNLN